MEHPYCLWLLSYYSSRVEPLQQRVYGSQTLKCLLSGLLQKKFADSWLSMTYLRFIHVIALLIFSVFLLFCFWIVCYCMNTPHFVSPFTNPCICGLSYKHLVYMSQSRQVFSPFLYRLLGNWIAGLYAKFLINCKRNWQTVFQSACTILCSQEHVRTPDSLYPCQYLALLIFYIIVIECVGVFYGLNLHLPIDSWCWTFFHVVICHPCIDLWWNIWWNIQLSYPFLS